VKRSMRFIAAGCLLGSLLACSPQVATLNVPSITATAVAPAVGGECDARSTRILANTAYSLRMEATADPYPSNCLYYCMWLPDAGEALEISLADALADLDLFVGYGSMEAIAGVDVVEGQTYTWKSNTPGTGNEALQIASPAAGVYYLEVCSYEGEATDFRLASSLR
jgi:hypothetical protein